MQPVIALAGAEAWVPLVLLAVLSLAIGFFVCRFLARVSAVLPEEAFAAQPWTAWLLLVPGVNLVWNFYFLLALTRGFAAAFRALGRELPRRETGEFEALAWSVVCLVGLAPWTPGLLVVLWLGGFVALVVLLFKLHSLRDRYLRIEGT